MKKTAFPYFLFTAIVLLASCKKEKSVDVNLHVQSQVTGQPIANARVELSYYEGKEPKGDARTISLGTTDASGNISATNMIKGKSYQHEVLIYANGYGKVIVDYLSLSLPYEPGSKMEKNVSLQPVYHYLVKLNNVNYLNAFDSAWITGPNGLSALTTGNENKTVYYNDVPSFGCSNWVFLPSVKLNLKVKRNTSVSESSETYTLTEGQVTNININF